MITPESKSDRNTQLSMMEPAHLQQPGEAGKVHLVPQALDNQWVPRGFLQKGQGKIIAWQEAEKEIESAARREYISALLAANRVVVNRAFFYNSSVLARDYENEKSCTALRQLFREGILLPYLLGEDSLYQEPRNFAFVKENFTKWTRVVDNLNVSAVRLSWDNATNQTRINASLAHNFHRLCMDLENKTMPALRDSLDLDHSAMGPFADRLEQLVTFVRSSGTRDPDTLAKSFVTREAVYKEFISGSPDVSARVYDFTGAKPFAAEIKQLVDVAYNVGLPDAIHGQLVTPADTIDRSALQETKGRPQLQDISQVSRLFKALAVDDVLNILNREVGFFDLGILTLPDVVEARRMDEWTLYNGALCDVAGADYLSDNAPGEFNSRLQTVASQYGSFLSAMTRSLSNSTFDRGVPFLVEAGHIAVHIAAHIAGMEAVSMIIDPSGESILKHAAEEQLTRLGTGLKQVVLRMAIWNPRSRALGRAAALQFDVFSKTIELHSKSFQELIREMQSIAREVTGRSAVPQKDLEIARETNVCAGDH